MVWTFEPFKRGTVVVHTKLHACVGFTATCSSPVSKKKENTPLAVVKQEPDHHTGV